MKHFFSIIHIDSTNVKYFLKQPSRMLMKNVHKCWLQYIKSKTRKMSIYTDDSYKTLDHIPSVFGVINQNIRKYNDRTISEINFCNSACVPTPRSVLEIHLFVPQMDAMQYFIQWQRYRKYWWSTLSQTPNLFSTSENKYEDKTAKVDIIAKFPGSPKPVERLKMVQCNEMKNCLTCTLCLEDALFALLQDGMTFEPDPCSKIPDDYLRLHRKIAPYKLSFAINVKEKSHNKETLMKIATLLHRKLEEANIPTMLPDLCLPYPLQLKESLRMGVIYTAVLDEDTHHHGILRLLNSSTMLSEQFHFADFTKYAPMLFEY